MSALHKTTFSFISFLLTTTRSPIIPIILGGNNFCRPPVLLYERHKQCRLILTAQKRTLTFLSIGVASEMQDSPTIFTINNCKACVDSFMIAGHKFRYI